MLHTIRTFSASLLLGLFLITACEDNPGLSTEEPPQNPPQIPSAQTMTVEMGEFEENNSQQKAEERAIVQSDNAFRNAAARAMLVKGVVDASLVVPRVLLKAADSTDAEFGEDGKWTWAFSKTAGDHSYEVRLVASEKEGDRVQWDFYVTNTEKDLNDQLFFSGVSTKDGHEGTWTYYNLNGELLDEPVSKVEWAVNGEDDVSLRLEVLSEQSEHTGDYLEYTFDGTIKHAVYFDASEETTAEIQWNVETKAGFLIAPNYNGGAKACWNSELQDTTCEEA